MERLCMYISVAKYISSTSKQLYQMARDIETIGNVTH